MNCNNCGKVNDLDSKFCIYCGAQIIDQIKYSKGNLEPFKSNNKWGYKDINSRDIIIAPKYDLAGVFKNKRAIVSLNNKYGVVDQNGKELSRIKYDFISAFDFGYTKVKRDGKWALLNNNCNEITSFKYDWIEFEVEGLIKVKVNNKIGLISDLGEEIISCDYDTILKHSSGLLKVTKNGKHGFTNLNGIVVLPCEYDEIYNYKKGFSIGFSIIKKTNNYGLINTLGEVIIPCKYSKIEFISNNSIKAKLKKDWYCFDGEGKDTTLTDSNFLKNRKTEKNIVWVFSIVLVLGSLTAFDFKTNNIGFLRAGLQVIIGEDEMDWMDITENYSMNEIRSLNPLRNYIQNHPNGNYVYRAQSRVETIIWIQTITSNNINLYQKYLDEYPKGKHVEVAKEYLYWKQVENSKNKRLLEGYLKKYYNGRFVHDAQDKIQKIDWQETLQNNQIYYYKIFTEKYPSSKYTHIATDYIAWENAKDFDHIGAYEDYINNFQNGKFRNEAREIVAWRTAVENNTIQAYKNYLVGFPNGINSKIAKELAEKMSICSLCDGSKICYLCKASGFYGKEMKVVSEKCPWLSRRNPHESGLCSTCNNTKKVWVNKLVNTVCHKCEGSGKCFYCNGSGKIAIN